MEFVTKRKIQKRNAMISIAKAIGIILMVTGHVFDKASWGVHYIYMFHMPLFFVLSGYFFKTPRSLRDLFVLLKKKIIGLYLPYLLWSTSFILLHNFLLKYDIGENAYSLSTMICCLAKSALTFVTTERVLVGFWFLKALFSAIIFLALFSMITRRIIHVNIYKKAVFLLFAVLVLLVLDMSNKTLLGMLYGGFFLCCGNAYRDLGLETKIQGRMWFMALGVWVLLLSRCYYDVSNTEMLTIDKTTFLPFTLSGCLGSIFILMAAKRIGALKLKLMEFIKYIGDHSLIILALHYPLIKVFDFYLREDLSEHTTLQHISGGGNMCSSSYCFISNL